MEAGHRTGRSRARSASPIASRRRRNSTISRRSTTAIRTSIQTPICGRKCRSIRSSRSSARCKDGSVRVSLFDEQVRDSIISQNVFVPGTRSSSSTRHQYSPRPQQRRRSWRCAGTMSSIKGLEFTGSVTWVNSRIISDPTWVPTRRPREQSIGGRPWRLHPMA